MKLVGTSFFFDIPTKFMTVALGLQLVCSPRIVHTWELLHQGMPFDVIKCSLRRRLLVADGWDITSI